MSSGSIGEIPIPGLDPYSEIVEISEDMSSEAPVKCPHCGSPHGTLFCKVMTIESDRDIISGDLSIRKMVMSRCLSCGSNSPVKFIMVRNM